MTKAKKLNKRWQKVLAGAIVAATIATGGFVFRSLPYFVGETVIEVVDGDTFRLANKQNIRLYGVRAPDIENCMGLEAKQALEKLVLGKKVIIRETVVAGNRPIALVYQNNLQVNTAMLFTGLAEYDRHGESETERMKIASDYAKSNQLGVYSATCLQTEPPDPKCLIKANIDIDKNTKAYFPPKCRVYSLVIIKKHEGDNWFCTEKEAEKAGFDLADGCNDKR